MPFLLSVSPIDQVSCVDKNKSIGSSSESLSDKSGPKLQYIVLSIAHMQRRELFIRNLPGGSELKLFTPTLPIPYPIGIYLIWQKIRE